MSDQVSNEYKNAYVLDIFFPLAHFKIPYTVKTRKTYIIPRKRAIISIFNAFFEKPISFWEVNNKGKRSKKEQKDNNINLNNFLVGVELIDFYKTSEHQTIVQIKGGGGIRTLSSTELLVNARYKLYLIPLIDIELNINPSNYIPFGGQNDYLASDWKLYREEVKILNKKEVNLKNYQLLPKDKVDKVIKAESILLENLFEDEIIVKGNITLKEELKFAETKDGSDIYIF